MRNTLKGLGLALFLSTTIGCAVAPTAAPQVEVVSVVELPGLSRDEVFNKARQWFSMAFVSGESVVDYEDKDAGTIIGNGRSPVEAAGRVMQDGFMQYYTLEFEYKMRVDVKDEKLRISSTITKFTYSDGATWTRKAGRVGKENVVLARRYLANEVENLRTYILTTHSDTTAW